MDRIEAKLHTVAAATIPMAMGPKPHNCLLHQYEEQIAGFKSEQTDISHSIISMKGGDKNLSGREIVLDRTILDVCLKIRRMLEANKPNPLPPAPMPVVVQDHHKQAGLNYSRWTYPPLTGIY